MDQLPVSRLEIEAIDASRGLRLVGDIDSHTAPSLDSALGGLDADGDVTVDMTEVGFVDSSGLRVLVGQHQRLGSAGHRLVLADPSDAVMRLLDITGLTGTIHTSRGPVSGEAG